MGMDGAVNLGSAYGEILIDTSQVERQLQNTFQRAEQAAGNAFNRIGRTLQGVGDSIYGVGRSLTLWTAPIAALGGYGLKVFGEFEDVLAEIQARTSATGEQMDAVKAKALEMGQATVFSSTEAAEAILQLLASGYDLEQSFAALPAVLDAAAAGGMDLGYTADVVTDALAMWNLEASQAGRVADALARGAAASSAEIPDLAQGLGNVGPLAAEMNLSLEDTIAILAAFSERGIKGAEAGTQLKSMLTNMTKPVDKVQDMWKALGISMYTASGQIRPLQAVLAELRDAMAGMSDEERLNVLQTLGGTYGKLGLSVLTSSDAMGDMNALMDEQADAATVASARLDTFNGKLKKLKSSVQTALIKALEPFVENVAKPLIDFMTDVVTKITEWMALNPELTAMIVNLLAALVAVGPALMIVGKLIGLIGGAIALSLGSPIALAIAAIAALVMAYKTNFLGIQTAVKSFVDKYSVYFNWIIHYTKMAIDALKRGDFQGAIYALGKVLEGLKPLLKKVLASLITWAKKMGEKLLSWAVEYGPPLLKALLELGKDVLKWLGEQVKPIGEKLLEWAGAFVDWVGPAAKELLLKIPDLLTDLLKWILDAAPDIVAKILEWAAAFIDWVGPATEELLVKLGDLLGDVIYWILAEFIPAVIKEAPGMIEAMLKFIVDAATQVGPKLLDFLVTITNFFVTDLIPGVAKAAWSIGESIVNGIWDGVNNLWDSFTKDLKDKVGGGIVGDVAGFLGVGSPAKKMIPIGEAIVQGLAVGMGAMQPVNEALAQLSDTLILPDMAVMGGARMPQPALAGATFNIEVGVTPDVVRAYPDGEEYGRAVGRGIEERLQGWRRWQGGGVVHG